VIKNKYLFTTQITITLVLIISIIAKAKNYITGNIFVFIIVLMNILFMILSSKFKKWYLVYKYCIWHM
jgi:hypothetical protein